MFDKSYVGWLFINFLLTRQKCKDVILTHLFSVFLNNVILKAQLISDRQNTRTLPVEMVLRLTN